MNLALLVVFIAALVATVGTLAWELSTNFGRTPRWMLEGSSWTRKFVALTVCSPAPSIEQPAPGSVHPPKDHPGANTHGDAA